MEIIMKIKEGFVLEELGDSYVAVAVNRASGDFSGMVRLNSTGAFIWKLAAERDITREQICDELTSVYEVDRAIAMRDINRMVDMLKEKGIIEE